jgi:DNA-binding XRE family transcriptional regulator
MAEEQSIFESAPIRLRVIRTVLDLKQSTFANFLKVCIHTLWNWENNDFSFSPKIRERFRFVGINAQWLEYGTGQPFRYRIETVRNKILFSIKQR